MPEEQVAAWQSRAELMTPVAKAWCTEAAQEVTEIGVQVHGRRGHDAALLDVAEAIERCLPALGMPDLAATMGS